MEDKRKTKSQFIRGFVGLHQQVCELEASKIECDQAKTESERARKYTDSILDTLREPLLVLDADLKILSANRSFYNIFKVTPRETVGNLIYTARVKNQKKGSCYDICLNEGGGICQKTKKMNQRKI